MKSASEEEVDTENNLTDFNVDNDHESDNEELIKYISHRILAMEESFLQLCKNKSICAETCNFDISFCRRNSLPDDTQTNFNYIDLIEELFREIHIINDTLMKVVNSNYSKNEKLVNLRRKHRNLFSRFSNMKIDYDLVKSDLSLKEEKIEEYEGLLRQNEMEIVKLQEKNREFREKMRKDRRDSGSAGLIMRDKGLDLHVNSRTSRYSFHNINNDLSQLNECNESKFNEQILFYEDLNKQMNKEKEEMKELIQNLRNVLTEREKTINSLNLEIEIQVAKVKEYAESLEKIKNEKNYLRNEIEVVKKEKTEYAQANEVMKTKFSRRNGFYSANFNSPKTRHYSTDNYALSGDCPLKLYGIGLDEESDKSVVRKYSLMSKKDSERENDNLLYDNNTIIIHEKVNENESDNTKEIGHTLANVLNSQSDSNNNSPDITMNNIKSKSEHRITCNTERISLTTSLEKIETGLKRTRAKLRHRHLDSSAESSLEGSPLTLPKKQLITQIKNLKINPLDLKFNKLEPRDCDNGFIVENGDNFTLRNEMQMTETMQMNNIINMKVDNHSTHNYYYSHSHTHFHFMRQISALKVKIKTMRKRIAKLKGLFKKSKKPNFNKKPNLSIVPPSYMNLSNLDSPVKDKQRCLTTKNQKLIDFKNIFNKINSKFHEVGKMVSKLSAESKCHTNNNSRIITNFNPSNVNLSNLSCLNVQPDDIFTKIYDIKSSLKKSITPSHSRQNSKINLPSVPVLNTTKTNDTKILFPDVIGLGFPKSSLRQVKEICFKLKSNNFDELENSIQKREKIENFDNDLKNSQFSFNGNNVYENNIIDEDICEEKSIYKYSEGIKEIYRKYFKHTDNFMKFTRDSLRRKKNTFLKGSDKQANEEGKVNFFEKNHTKQSISSLSRLLGTSTKSTSLLEKEREKTQYSKSSSKNLFNLINSSIYMKALVRKSTWVKEKE